MSGDVLIETSAKTFAIVFILILQRKGFYQFFLVKQLTTINDKEDICSWT